ncbi:hypothetical protein L202_01719 [Cryptococcus amylolentus CBS 6039]|uniref:Lipoyl-binding domain-containing protein n=2 Tax=Cryptococcus amylolentus TaxID=104669 RepID=A0A1E3I545_9TREE|nr:hypothetical protein L202_01719 [Cryptococcus amylolentus CBS 6039]ODN83617.1 hypothetical protein L202_01719 [Cryptococcus amylolentus CBS 6039]ODO11097.1 hypothetical protein I350_01699 [Cryptococcus amylolentus CBS 6273]
MRTTRQAMGLLRNGARAAVERRALQNVRFATTNMGMPAMSPTMTEGGVAEWKLKEGDSFAAGDVLLEVETDKATIDVEAQEDGILGKIIIQNGAKNIPVGQIIAILAEEGDDISNLEVPKEEASPSSSAPKEEKKEAASEQVKSEGRENPRDERKPHEHKEIKHPKPLFPSVSRLLQESSLTSEEISKLKGTGRHGMLTKGDVLVALGKIKNPYGSAEKLVTDAMGASGRRASENKLTEAKNAPGEGGEKKKEAPLDGAALRRLIVKGMSKATQPAEPIVKHESTPLPRSDDFEFDAILAPYASLLPAPKPSVKLPSEDDLKAAAPKKDEFAGLY